MSIKTFEKKRKIKKFVRKKQHEKPILEVRLWQTTG
jgi:hypothetical protein